MSLKTLTTVNRSETRSAIKSDILILGANKITCYDGKTHFTEDVEVVGGVELKLQINDAVCHIIGHTTTHTCVPAFKRMIKNLSPHRLISFRGLIAQFRFMK